MELNGFIMRAQCHHLVAEPVPEKLPQLDQRGRAIAGFVLAHPVRRKYGRILTLDILPEARRLGLATNLMNACEERLRSLGCTEIYLETAVNNEPGICGFIANWAMRFCERCRSTTPATRSTPSRWASGCSRLGLGSHLLAFSWRQGGPNL